MKVSEKNLGNCHHTSVVGVKLIRILAAIYNLLDGPYVKHISLTTLHSLHTQIIALMALNGTVGNLILRNQTQLWTCIKNSTLFRTSKKDYLNHIGMFMQVDFTNEFTLGRLLKKYIHGHIRRDLDQTVRINLRSIKGFFPKDLICNKRRL